MQDSLHTLMLNRWAGVCEKAVLDARKFARLLRKRFTSPYRGEHTVLPQPGSGNDFAAGFP